MKMTNLLDIPFGYRAVGYWGGGYGNQELVKDFRGIVKVISEHLGIDELGLSVCAYKENKPYLLFLPFDFDSDNLKEAGDESILLYNHFVKAGYDTHMTFSGRKGYHVYISVKPKSYPKQQMKMAQRYFKDKLKLKTLDVKLFGDRRRLMRIPYTYNLRGGTLCREIFYSKGVNLDLDNILLKTDFKKHKVTYKNRGFHSYPCIESIIREDPEPRELIRLSYTALRLDKGWTEDEIIEEMESFGWIDYDEEICRKKINYIDNGNYYPLSCRTMNELGWCPGKCEYGDMDTLLSKIGVKK